MLTLIIAAAALASPVSADEAAVRDLENRWSAAFVTGDAAYLEQILVSDYVSLGADGAPHSKSAVVAAAGRYAAAHPGTKGSPMPATSTVQIEDGVALVRHFGPTEISVDVLQKRSGRWVAWYSQHTALKPGV